MRYPREKNVLDTKWAHPEVLADGTYTVLHDLNAVKENVNKTIAEQDALREPWRKPLFDNFIENCDPREKDEVEWSEVYTEHGCPLEPEAKVRMLMRRPKDIGKEEKLPVVIYYHGGGLYCGTPETALDVVSRLMLESGVRAVVVLPEYRLAPAYEYPAAINDCHAAYLWLVEHAEEMQLDTDKFIIMGGSTGGHMTLSTAFRLKDYGYHGVMPRGLISCIPVMDDVAFTDSFRLSFEDEEGNIMGWDVHGPRTGFRLWLGERYGDPSLPPEAVPNRATAEDVKGLPPVWFPCCAELDTGRDSVYRFAQLLHAEGIFCDFHVWGACSHLLMGFDSYEEPLIKRVWSVIEASLKDAVNYDFRRPWLNEE